MRSQMKVIRSESKSPTESPTDNSVVELLVAKTRPTENSVTDAFRPTIGHRIVGVWEKNWQKSDRWRPNFRSQFTSVTEFCDRKFGHKFCTRLVQTVTEFSVTKF